jgi:dipeptidyl-peptidase-4
VTDNLTFLEDHSFILTSEKDGFNHIYHYTKEGELKNQITKGNWEVTAYYGFNESAKTIYYQSVENGSINRDVYSIRLNGKNKKRLSSEEGTNGADFSANFTYFIKTQFQSNPPTKINIKRLQNRKTGKKHKRQCLASRKIIIL